MEIPNVTLKELADFLIGLPDDEKIQMWTGDANAQHGCLMTKYGRTKGWQFTICEVMGNTAEWVDRKVTFDPKVVATLETSPFKLFKYEPGSNYTLVGPWKKTLKKEFKN